MLVQLSETERAYLAGIIDGEGSINGTSNLELFVSVSQADPTLLHWLAERFGGEVRENTSKYGRWYQWTRTGRSARELLLAIRPYTLLKKLQVDIGLTYINALKTRGRGSTLTDGEKWLRARLIAALQNLSLKGTREARRLEC